MAKVVCINIIRHANDMLDIRSTIDCCGSGTSFHGLVLFYGCAIDNVTIIIHNTYAFVNILI